MISFTLKAFHDNTSLTFAIKMFLDKLASAPLKKKCFKAIFAFFLKKMLGNERIKKCTPIEESTFVGSLGENNKA